jgi:hypothetical protein
MNSYKLISKPVIFIVVLTVMIPLNRRGDAIIHSHILNWRMGAMVKAQAVSAFPQLPLASLAIGLEPEDLRRGHMMKAAGKAKFYGPKKNNCYQLEYACRYEPVWKTGPFHFWPAQIKITDCVAVRTETPF